jgi:hypothetical protein
MTLSPLLVLRRVGFGLVLLSAVGCLVHAVLLLFLVYTIIPDGLRVHELVFGAIAACMGIGFVLAAAGSASKKELQATIDAKAARGNGELVDEAYRPAPGGSNLKHLSAVMLVFVAGIVIAILVLELPAHHCFLVPSVTAAIIFCGICLLAILLARVAGFINVDVHKMVIAGLHLHESVLAILLLFAGTVMFFLGSGVETYFGFVLIVAGVFFLGRDWKDLAEGKIITKAEHEQ